MIIIQNKYETFRMSLKGHSISKKEYIPDFKEKKKWALKTVKMTEW